MSSLEGKVALVTGASRQVGRGVAVGLAEAGAKVYVTARHMSKRRYGRKNPYGTLKQTVKEIEAVGGTGVAIACDHTDDKQTRAVIDQIEKDEGQLDILVNAVWSGYDKMRADKTFPWSSDFWDQPPVLWDDMFVGVRASYMASSRSSGIKSEKMSAVFA